MQKNPTTVSQARQRVDDQLNMKKGKKQLRLEKRRVAVNPQSYNLVIGLGGTGCDALLEVKGMIDLTCREWEHHVAYIAFDTDNGTEQKQSSAQTGSITLRKGEWTLLDPNGLGQSFADNTIDRTKAQYPERFLWVDERLNPTNAASGASGIRQLGRLIGFNNYDRIRKAISNAIQNLTTTQVDGNAARQMNVFILSGISGGTGSGSFLDIAYIVRDVLSNAPGFAQTMNSIYGYLFLPDVNLNNPEGSGEAKNLRRNAYAALQELDFNLSLSELNEQYKIVYPGGASYTTGVGTTNLYDYIHLVSATSANGNTVPNAYKVSMRAIAQNILSFVANEKALTIGGNTAFAITSHYSNIDGAILAFESDHNKKARRSQRYLAIGSYSYDLPIDDIMMYITCLLFDHMNEMFNNQPTEGHFNSACNSVGVYVNQVRNAFQAKVPALQPPTVPERGDLPDYVSLARNIYDAIAHGNNAIAQQLDQAESAIKSAMYTTFDNIMSDCFRDPSRGPVFANQLIVRASVGLIDVINAQMHGLLDLPNGIHPDQCYMEHVQQVNTAKSSVDGLFGRNKKNAATYATKGRALMNEYVLLALRSRILSVLDDVAKYISGKNSTLYSFVSESLKAMKDIFEENANLLTNTHETVDARGKRFTWEPITIPTIDKFLKEKFEAVYNDPDKKLIPDFVQALWNQALIWMQDSDQYDPRQFVSDYINEKFGEMATMTIEDVVFELLAPGQTEDQACQNLIDLMMPASAPLFYPLQNSENGNTVKLISIPRQCQKIFQYVNANLAGKNIIIQQSDINNRIYAQTVQCGIALADYQEIWAAEDEYAKQRAFNGLHLVDPHGKYAPEDSVSWTSLPTLIPRYLRPKHINSQAVRDLVAKEDATKKRILDVIDPQTLQSRCSALYLDTSDNLKWQMMLTLTDTAVERKGDVLTISQNKQELARFDLKDAEAWRTNESQLNKILVEGMKQGLKQEGITETVRTVIQNLDSTENRELALDYIAEEYARAIYLVHDFERELDKFDTIRRFLDDLKVRESESKERTQRMMRFAQMKLLERIALRIKNSTTVGSLVRSNGEFRDFTEIPEGPKYLQEYYLYLYYYRCLDGEKLTAEERISAEGLERRKTFFKGLVNKVHETFDEQSEKLDPVIVSYLDKVTGMIREAEKTRDIPAIRDTREGFMTLVDKEVVEFYDYWLEALKRLEKQLRQQIQVMNRSKPGYEPETVGGASDIGDVDDWSDNPDDF